MCREDDACAFAANGRATQSSPPVVPRQVRFVLTGVVCFIFSSFSDFPVPRLVCPPSVRIQAVFGFRAKSVPAVINDRFSETPVCKDLQSPRWICFLVQLAVGFAVNAIMHQGPRVLYLSFLLTILCQASQAAWQENVRPKMYVQLGTYHIYSFTLTKLRIRYFLQQKTLFLRPIRNLFFQNDMILAVSN